MKNLSNKINFKIYPETGLYDVKKVNPNDKKDIQNYWSILFHQYAGSTLLEKTSFKGEVLKTLVSKMKNDKEKMAFIEENIDNIFVKDGIEMTLFDILSDILKYNTTQPRTGMYLITDKMSMDCIGVYGMLPLSVEQDIKTSVNKISRVELIMHLKEAYTGKGIGKQMSDKYEKEFFRPACNKGEFSANAKYEIDTLKDNTRSHKFQKKQKWTGVADNTQEKILNNKEVVLQEGSIKKLKMFSDFNQSCLYKMFKQCIEPCKNGCTIF